MVSIQMASAAMGTLTMAGTPNRPRPDAMPANSDSVTVVFEISSASMASALRRTPNCSRIRDAKPLPVPQPMRAAVSCATMSKRHMTGTVQSWPYPKNAPALEYVATPPASAPARAATMPGPIAARTRFGSSLVRAGLASEMSATGASARFLSSSDDTREPPPWKRRWRRTPQGQRAWRTSRGRIPRRPGSSRHVCAGRQGKPGSG